MIIADISGLEFLWHSRKGDPVAFASLVRLYAGRLCFVANAITGDKTTAATLAMETLIATRQHTLAFDSPFQLTSHLYHEVAELAARYMREQKGVERVQGMAAGDRQKWHQAVACWITQAEWIAGIQAATLTVTPPARSGHSLRPPVQQWMVNHLDIEKELMARLYAAIEGLGELHREIFKLRFLEKCSYEEISDRLLLSVFTVKRRLAEVVFFMQKRLKTGGTP